MNNHITKNLTNYIKSSLPFEYAILLTGSWGSGKTFFIKDYINSIDSNKNILYISLNGLESLNDIYYLIIESKYKNHKSSNISFGALKSIKDLSLLDKKEVENKIDLNNLLKFDNNYILIFDDIERVSKKIDINDLFGYIFREFIEKIDAKVVLIANEDEILSEELENNEYNKIKEKLIGKTFEVQSDIDSAYNNFVKDLSESRTILEKYKKTILDIHKISGYNNLRILKQSICEFNRLYLILDDEIKKEEQIIKKFLIEFLINSIEYKKANPDIELFEKNKDDFDNLKHSLKDKYKILEKVSEIENYQIIYNINWKDLLTKGIFNKKNIYIDRGIKKEPLWKKLYNNKHRTDKEFNDNLLTAIEILKNRENLSEIKEIGELKHIISILLWGFNNKFNVIIKNYNSLDNIIKIGKDYLPFMIENGVKNDINEENDTSFYNFYTSNLKEFKNFLKYINLKYNKEENITFIKKAKDIFKNLNEKNIYDFEEVLTILETTPVLKDFSPKDFLEKSLTPNLRKELLDIIKMRYKSSDSILNLFEEFKFLKEFLKLLNEKLETLKGELSYYQISKFIQTFTDILKSFEYIERVKEDLEFETVEEISQGYNDEYIQKIKNIFY